ncbi:MAG: hypothetical protein GQ570_13750 [Helicobacteraceae bacterium]|nr:hypothetical protein [Helicobacteraceae bacterium]
MNNISSFTDEQLLNLINNTIVKKTKYNVHNFTGGGVQISTTYNHRVVKYKIYLTFGFNSKNNSLSYSEEISEDLIYIWQKAILLKSLNLHLSTKGSNLNDLNSLMNTDIKIEDIKIVDRDIDIDRGSNEVVTKLVRTSYEHRTNI